MAPTRMSSSPSAINVRWTAAGRPGSSSCRPHLHADSRYFNLRVYDVTPGKLDAVEARFRDKGTDQRIKGSDVKLSTD